MSNKRFRRRSEFKAKIFPSVRDRMWPLLKEFKIPALWGYRIELAGADITDDPRYQDYSLEFFALDPAVAGDAGKTALSYPIEDGRELYIWVQRLSCKPRTVATYQDLWCAVLNKEADKPLGWQTWIVTTMVPREKVKRETAILLDGLALFDKVHERTNGYSRERAAEIFFNAADKYAESEPTVPKFDMKRWAEEYLSKVKAEYPVSRENAYYYFRKYKGLRGEVVERFKQKQREMNV